MEGEYHQVKLEGKDGRGWVRKRDATGICKELLRKKELAPTQCFLLLKDLALKVRAQTKDITRAKRLGSDARWGEEGKEESQPVPGLILSFDMKPLGQLFSSHTWGMGCSPGLPAGIDAPYGTHRLVSWSFCANIHVACLCLVIKGNVLGESLHQNHEIIL